MSVCVCVCVSVCVGGGGGARLSPVPPTTTKKRYLKFFKQFIDKRINIVFQTLNECLYNIFGFPS